MSTQRYTGAYLAASFVSSSLASALFFGYATAASKVEDVYSYSSQNDGSGWLVFGLLFALIGVSTMVMALKQIGDTIDLRHEMLVEDRERNTQPPTKEA